MTSTIEQIPYSDDLDAMETELAWLRARIRRVVLGKLKNHNASGMPSHRRQRGPEMTRQELLQAFRKASAEEVRLRAIADGRGGCSDSALDRLCRQYNLNEDERTILLLAAAPLFSAAIMMEFGQLDTGGVPGMSNLTVEVLFNFLELSMADRIRKRRLFSKRAPLLANDLITLGLRDRYSDPQQLLYAEITLTCPTFQYLIGDAVPEDELLDFSSLEEPRCELRQVVLPAEATRRIVSAVDRHEQFLQRREAWGFDEIIQYGKGMAMLFHGPPGTGKTMTAHAIANHLGKRVLNVDIPTFLGHHEHDRFLPALFREARLRNAVLFFDECEALFASRHHGNLLMNVLLTELEQFDGIAIMATNAPQVLDTALERRLMVRVAFPRPSRAHRVEIWRRHIPTAAPLASDVDLDDLATRFDLTGGYIKNAVLMALASSVQAGRDHICQDDLVTAATDQQVQLADSEGQPTTIPSARITDIALEPQVHTQVSEVIDAARQQKEILEQWGIGDHLSYGKGVVALLQGPPGTGKTLCAEVIAGELGRPLLTCNLAGMLSRYVGGTEQNLERTFDQARRQNVVLFIDEVDAWLGNRKHMSHEHDHRMVNHLLTLIEQHEGVVLMATNLSGHLDEALARRVGWTLRFSPPGAVQRADIWRRLLPDTAPGAKQVDIGRLARDHELTGAQIRNAVFRAAFRAARRQRPLSTYLLATAATDELGTPQPVLGWTAADA